MNGYPSRLVLPSPLWGQMLAHITACLPEEACGVLGGPLQKTDADGWREVAASLVLPVENALHSPVRFRMDPSAQLKAFYAFEEQGLELLAVFHSHPRGPEHPSPTDLAEFAYPGVLSLILSPQPGEERGLNWQVRAFAIHGSYSAQSAFSEVPVAILAQPGFV